VNVHLVDGTYELFRHYYALPSRVNAAGEEIAAVRGVVGSVLALLAEGATHLAVATDHVIESFRNELWPGYKDGSGIDPPLRSQFEPLEDALRALGVTVWAMVRYEADDALAAGAELARADERVERIFICTPDKDLAQCVEGRRIVQLDRRRGRELDEAGVREKFGVEPASIPDYLALVGDAADGFPGLPGWGARSAAAVLARYLHLEDIPASAADWEVPVRGAAKLAATLQASWEQALLFRRLATLVREAPVNREVDDLRWRGPEPALAEWAERLEAPELIARSGELAAAR
jgi:5'-3' exonuclease